MHGIPNPVLTPETKSSLKLKTRFEITTAHRLNTNETHNVIMLIFIADFLCVIIRKMLKNINKNAISKRKNDIANTIRAELFTTGIFGILSRKEIREDSKLISEIMPEIMKITKIKSSQPFIPFSLLMWYGFLLAILLTVVYFFFELT
jgi:hypothetical protein